MTTTHPAQAEVARDRSAIEKATPLILRAVRRWLTWHSITILRISMGLIIFGYGLLKYFPGMSPAEDLVQTTMNLLTFGFVPGKVALVFVATLECAIGLSLIIGRGLRVAIYPLAFWAIGILSPIVLLPQRLFSGPDHAPTLEGQYVLKDIVFLTAILVIATAAHRHKDDAERQPTDEDKPTIEDPRG